MQEFFKKNELLKTGLYIVSTPIGNYQDITLRAISVLNSCDIIFCEDTRVTAKLLKFLEIPKKPLYFYNEHSGEKDRIKIINFIKEGKSVALVSDAGTPLISDPGYKIVNRCNKENISIFPISGISSVITALSVSGLPTDKFSFFGFLPSKKSERKNKLMKLKDKEETIVVFETAVRLLDSLRDCLEILGDRKICIARELTKMYEDVRTDNISRLINHYENSIIKGEIVLVIEGYSRKLKDESDMDSIKVELRELLDKMRLKDAVDLVANKNDINKKKVYQLALEIKSE